MRPLRLVLTAFGPFADTQTVDFRRLGDLRLFLINGPIGAGKTTLLDGICYALYGESSGEERKPGHMRSHLAPPDRATEVVFDFALGDKAYRIRRSPQQDRPARRGGGIVNQPRAAEIHDITRTTDPAEAGHLISANAGDVDERIGDLVGFSAPEFRQVVMLPQGRFRDLLAADSGEREKILRTLFQTGRYAGIEERLKEAAKTARQVVERAVAQERAILRQAGAENAAEVADMRDALATDVAERAAAIERLDAEEAALRRVLDTATQLAARFAARDAARTASQAVEAERAARALDRTSLDAARRAALVEPVATAARLAADELSRAEGAVADATADRDRAQAAVNRAQAALDQEEALAPRREALAVRVAELTAIVGRVADLDTLRTAAMTAEDAVRTTADARTRAVARVETAAASARAAREALAAVELAAGRLGGARVEADDAARRRDQRRQLQRVATAATALAARHARALLEIEGCRRTRQDADTVLREAERAWLDGQAAYLAAHLTEGAACPVCGATEHPALAQPHADLPERPDLDALRADTATAAAAVEAAQAELTVAIAKQSEAVATRDQIAAGLGPDADADPAELERRADVTRDALAAAQSAAANLPQARTAAAQADGAHVQAVEAERTLALAHDEARRTAADALARLDERLSGIPEDLRDPGRPAAALKAARAEAEALSRALDGARTAAGAARERLAATAAAVVAAADARVRAGERRDLAEAGLADALAGQGFADVRALRAAWLAPDRIAALVSAIAAFERRDATVRGMLEETEAAVAGLEPPDVAAATATHAAARTAADTARSDLATTQERWRNAERLARDLAEIAADRTGAEARWSTAQRVAEVAGGGNGLNLSFQRWVLGALLDDVLLSANRRLQVMSRGRYLLKRAEDLEDRRRKAGLDLDVLDSHTDRPRSVRTLSGGEGFLAALSLALGVVDVVQAYAGGIRVDTLFIDEGFGSLDPEALDAALQALLDLQSTGRLVGVISHVAELRDRIPARLDVIKATGGSRVEMSLP